MCFSLALLHPYFWYLENYPSVTLTRSCLDFRFQISDFGFQISYFGFQMLYFGFQIGCYRFQIKEFPSIQLIRRRHCRHHRRDNGLCHVAIASAGKSRQHICSRATVGICAARIRDINYPSVTLTRSCLDFRFHISDFIFRIS